ncbi:hypothetical protein H4S02_005026, partial [Coemansia sp. RSA 2611]
MFHPPPPANYAYGMPVAAAPKIRHPNRAPCTTPSKTLYIRNLNEKIKIPVLTTALRALFETYGAVVEIRARHSIRMRGQAFITFAHQDDATRAHGEVQGFLLFGKPMFIEYARMPAEVTVLAEGGDVAAFRRERVEAREQQKPAAAVEEPNKILFLQGLSKDVRVEEIEQTFGAHAGFVEVRWVAVKPD